MSLDAAAAKGLFDALISHARSLGLFARVNGHDPGNAPGVRLSASVTLGSIKAEPADSGIGAVTVTVTFMVRIWSSMNQKPLDGVDPEVLAATSALLNEYASHYTLGGTVRDIDALALSAQPGYLQQEGTEYRVVEITVPIVVNDAWTVAA